MNQIAISSTFRKPNSALVMMPKVGRLTSVSRKIFNVLLHSTQNQIQAIIVNGKPIEATHYFHARLDELVGPIEVGNSNLTDSAKKALIEMRRTEVDWEAPDASSGVIWSSMSLLSEVKIVKTGGILFAYWALPPGLLSVIADPQRFTPIDIGQLAKLKTYSAVALYEICVRYKNNPTGLTSENSLEWWVDALTQSAPKIDPKTKKPKLRVWSKFKSEQVNEAINEINTKSDIRVELLEKKTGKAITSIQFKVLRISQSVDSAKVIKANLSPALALQSSILGLHLKDVSKLIDSGIKEEVLQIGLTKLEARQSRKDLPIIKSTLGYLRSVIAESNAHVFPDAVQNPLEGDLSKPVMPNAEPKLVSYKEQRRFEVRTELINLEKDEQRKYAELTLEYFQNVGLATPAISRKLASGDWMSGPLFSKMTEIYAVERYGVNWDALKHAE